MDNARIHHHEDITELVHSYGKLLIEIDHVFNCFLQAVELNIYRLILLTTALLSQHFRLSRHIFVDKDSVFMMRKHFTSNSMMHVLAFHRRRPGDSSNIQDTFLVEVQYTIAFSGGYNRSQ